MSTPEGYKTLANSMPKYYVDGNYYSSLQDAKNASIGFDNDSMIYEQGADANKYSGLNTGLAAVNAGANVMNAYTGWKGLGLAEDQFNFEKAAANRNLQNQGLAYNTAVDKSAGIVAAGSGTMNQQQANQYRQDAKKNYMDTSVIG